MLSPVNPVVINGLPTGGFNGVHCAACAAGAPAVARAVWVLRWPGNAARIRSGKRRISTQRSDDGDTNEEA